MQAFTRYKRRYERRRVRRSLIFCVILTLLVGVWNYVSLAHLDKDWRVVDENGMTVLDPERSYPFLYWVDDEITIEQANKYLPFGYRIERIEQPRLSDSDVFPGLLVCVFSTLLLATVYGVQTLAARHDRAREEDATLTKDHPSPNEPPSQAEERPTSSLTTSSADLDSRADRLENLRRLYDAGILTREEYETRKKTL